MVECPAIMCDWIPLVNLVVQCLLLLALVWYAWETWKIRKASQEQVEALQKPCLTLVTAPRDYDDAVLDMDDAVGGMIVAASQGSVSLQNMGSGPAVNVEYRFNPVDPPAGANVARAHGYLQNIPAAGDFVIALAREVLRNLEYECVITYDSLSGRRYRSSITIKNLVLTAFHFERQK